MIFKDLPRANQLVVLTKVVFAPACVLFCHSWYFFNSLS